MKCTNFCEACEALKMKPMLKRVSIIFLLLNLLGGFSDTFGQQPFTYTQYMNSVTPYNANYSLLDKTGSITILGRQQWAGIDGAPSSLSFSGNLPITAINASAGLIVLHDQFAVEKLSEVSAFFAKEVQLSDNTFLGGSFTVGLRAYVANYSELDSFDPKFRDNLNETSGTTGISVMYYSPEKFYIGASLPRLSIKNLGKASTEENRYLKNNYYFNAGFVQVIGSGWKIKPATLVSYTHGLPVEANFSTSIYVKDQLGLGVNYNTSHELAGILSYQFVNNMMFAYSYQTGFGKYAIGNAGGNATHEITFGLRFGKDFLPRIL